MWNLVTCPERRAKQGMVMSALARGMKGRANLVLGDTTPASPFMICGQLWAAERMCPEAMRLRTPFWVVDNGYYKQSGKGRHLEGHWELTYRGLVPVMLNDPDYRRMPASEHLKDWETPHGGHVLIADPGPTFGRMIGLNMKAWSDGIEKRVRQHTDRPIKRRTKWSATTVEEDLVGASVLVTAASHVALDAIIRGIPAIVTPESPAAPVCSTNLADIENPPRPDRTHCWASLMCQQFTLKEMSSGYAWKWQQRIAEQVDEETLSVC